MVLAIDAGFDQGRLLLLVGSVNVCAFVEQILCDLEVTLGTGDRKWSLAVEIL